MRTRSVSWSASPIRFLLTLAACALAASGVALAQTPPANPPAAQPPTQPVGPPTPPPGAADPTLSQLEAARRAMAERNYAAAADAFAAFVEKAPTSPRADEAAFLAARARFLAAKYAEAAAAAEAFEARFPKSLFLLKARALRAESRIQLRDHAAAAELLRARAEELDSTDTRAALAGFYLELAREFFVPPVPTPNPTEKEADHKPDFGRALALFTSAREVGLPEERVPEVLVAVAYCQLRLGQTAEAEQAAQIVVRDYKKFEARAQALFLLGAARFAQSQWSSAREMYQTLIDDYPASPWAPRARFRIGESYQPLAPRDETDRDNGVAAWRALVEKHADDGHAPLAQFGIAQALAAKGDSAGAVAAWNAFLARWPKHAEAPKAQFSVAQTLLAQNRFEDATTAATQFLAAYPSDPLWTQAQGLLVEAAWQRGVLALTEKDYDKAHALWSAFIDQFPLSPRATQAQFALGEVRAAQGRWADAIADWRKAAAKFPQEAAAPEVLLKAARATEEKLVRMDEALAGYEAIAKQYGGASAGREAGLRAAQMKEKFLLLRVERSYTTAETAKLHLETRNVERIELRAYRLDLLEYFRKKSTIANFEQIAVDVVKPDKTWEEPIREYERLKLISKEVDLPLSGEGAWILVAREKDYTATTLVLISDLSVVTKEAPQQLLVFAKDEVKGAPAEGVNVLVSDGSSIVGEGRTGKDGTWSKEFERPRGSARIFVWRGASYASNESALTNLAVWGYQTKVYLYTDRPVYRPNQIVHVKGIVRRVKGGYYDVSAGEKLKLSVRDPNGLVLVEKELTTNDFGTVAEDCFLGDAPALGTYAVAAMLGDSPYAGEFKVEEYRKPEFLVDVRPEREAYALGETVKAKIKVTYVFGGAVPDAELRVRAMKSPYKFDTTRYADYAWYYQAMAKEEEEARRKKAPQGEEGEVAETILETTVRTDRNGEAEVSVPTGHVDRNVTIGIAVLARDVTNRWVSGYASVPMTARSFWSVVKTEKKLYQPKETLTATLITVNAAETPVPTEGKLIVVRRRQASGQVVEDAVQEAPASTDEGGRGEVKLVIDKPGDYVLRYVGTDRARKQAGEEGSAAITVEGAAEDLAKQARIVADRQEYKRGEKARVVVSSPIEGVWALLTYEGERVFEHQVLFLKDRATTLSVEMKDEFAPNVFLSIAIPHKNTLYKDTDEVRVFKFATLAVAARPGEVKPGSAVTFDVAATDQNGRPVEAEFSLGLVDEAVYAVESERAPHILSHFYAGARRNAVVTRTSYEFKHAAQTKTVSADLKKEMERRVTEATAAIAAGERALAEEGRELYALEELAKAEKGSSLGDAIGIGGGAGGGGRYGGSFGGRVNRRSKGGGTKNGDDAGGADEPAPADKANAPASAPRPGTPTGGLRKQAESLRRRGEAKLKQGDLDAAKADFSEALEGESGEYEKTIEDVQKALELDSKDGKPRGWGKMPGNVNAASQEQLGEVAGKYYKRTSLTAWIAPVLRRNFADTAFWVAQARTDANGKATITVTLPDNLTTWKATARCVTRDTLVGSGTARVTAKKDLLVRVDAPRFLTQHDEIDLAAFVHNNLAAAKDVKTEVTANGLALAPAPGAGPGAAAAAAAAADAQLTLVGPELKGIEPRALGAWSRRVLAAAAGKARVQAKAQTDAESDALELEIPILPHGLAVVATERGQVVDRALVDFLVPGEGVVPGTEKVEIRAVPSVALSLLDAISYLQEYPYGCIEQTLNRFAPAIAARAAMRKLGLPQDELAARLDKLVNAGLLRVAQLQNEDGGWGWWDGDSSHPYTTAYVLECLAECMAAGYPVNEPMRAKALGFAAGQMLPSLGADLNAKAAILYGLALHRVASDEEALRVYRQRDTLEPYAVALAAMAFHKLGKAPYAAQTIELLRASVVAEGELSHWKAKDGYGWMNDAVETTAQAVRALLLLDPANTHIPRAVAWLQAQKHGDHWSSTKDTAAVVRATSDWLAATGTTGQDYDVDLFLNDKPLRSWHVAKGQIPVKDAYLVLGANDVKRGKNALRFEKKGTGEFTYAVTTSYFRAAEDIPADGQRVTVTRRYRDLATVQAQEKGNDALTGYTILKPEKRPADTLPSLDRSPLGSKYQVELKIAATEELQYVMLEDPIPAGCEPVELSVKGPATKSERHDNRMVFFFTKLGKGETAVTYLVDAVAAGRYHALPAQVSLMYRPEVHGHSAESRLWVQDKVELEAAGGKGREALPDELYLAGKAAWAKSDAAAAKAALLALPLSDLSDDYRLDCLAILLGASLTTGPAADVTRFYEGTIDLEPGRAFVAGDLTKIARAYVDTKEPEQGHFLLARAIGQHFVRDLKAVQALRDLGRLPLAYDRLEKLLRDYPDSLGSVQAQSLALANEYLSVKPPVDPAKSEPEQRQAEREQVLRGVRALRQFIVEYPDLPVCDRVQWALVQAETRLAQTEDVVRDATALLVRYPKSDFLDEAQYALASAQAGLGRYDEARAAAERLIATKYLNERGEPAPSPYNEAALYLLGKIAHVMGDLAKAADCYDKTTFADAKAALAFLRAKELTLGPTQTVGVTPPAGQQEPAPVALPVRYKNLKDATLKLYKVDLLVLLATKKDLANLAGVDLTGITPLAEWKAEFAGAKPFASAEQPVEVKVPEPGAYLVVARAEDVGASTVVLRTDLTLKVQQLENRVRVYAYGGPEARPARGAFVKISDGQSMVAEGYTDERGVFEGGVGRPLPRLSVSADWNGNPALYVSP